MYNFTNFINPDLFRKKTNFLSEEISNVIVDMILIVQMLQHQSFLNDQNSPKQYSSLSKHINKKSSMPI